MSLVAVVEGGYLEGKEEEKGGKERGRVVSYWEAKYDDGKLLDNRTMGLARAKKVRRLLRH